jgi:GGDEF domain-containing protein
MLVEDAVSSSQQGTFSARSHSIRTTVREPTAAETRAIDAAPDLPASTDSNASGPKTAFLFLANHDALTGLPNRAPAQGPSFRQACWLTPRDYDRWGVTVGRRSSLDNFKIVNDSLGHIPATICSRTRCSASWSSP